MPKIRLFSREGFQRAFEAATQRGRAERQSERATERQRSLELLRHQLLQERQEQESITQAALQNLRAIDARRLQEDKQAEARGILEARQGARTEVAGALFPRVSEQDPVLQPPPPPSRPGFGLTGTGIETIQPPSTGARPLAPPTAQPRTGQLPQRPGVTQQPSTLAGRLGKIDPEVLGKLRPETFRQLTGETFKQEEQQKQTTSRKSFLKSLDFIPPNIQSALQGSEVIDDKVVSAAIAIAVNGNKAEQRRAESMAAAEEALKYGASVKKAETIKRMAPPLAWSTMAKEMPEPVKIDKGVEESKAFAIENGVPKPLMAGAKTQSEVLAVYRLWEKKQEGVKKVEADKFLLKEAYPRLVRSMNLPGLEDVLKGAPPGAAGRMGDIISRAFTGIATIAREKRAEEESARRVSRVKANIKDKEIARAERRLRSFEKDLSTRTKGTEGYQHVKSSILGLRAKIKELREQRDELLGGSGELGTKPTTGGQLKTAKERGEELRNQGKNDQEIADILNKESKAGKLR